MAYDFIRTNRTIDVIYNDFTEGKLIVDKSYQRRKVWNDEDKVRLIETILLGLVMPEVYFWVSNVDEDTGKAEVRETFKLSGVGTIAGCYVTSGKVFRGSKVRIVRDGFIIHEGQLAALRRFKDDVKEVGNAQEGGLMIENYNDIKVDDVIEAYIMEEIKR